MIMILGRGRLSVRRTALALIIVLLVTGRLGPIRIGIIGGRGGLAAKKVIPAPVAITEMLRRRRLVGGSGWLYIARKVLARCGVLKVRLLRRSIIGPRRL